MPATAEIRDWHYQEGVLEVTITDTQLENRVYVERLGESRRFADVAVEPGAGPDKAVIRLEVM